MRRFIFLTAILCIGFISTFAQSQTSHDKQPVVKKKNVTESKPANLSRAKTVDTASFTSTSANKAYAATSGLSIADPTINLLNQRANGSNAFVSRSGIVGMPKSSYGFARGKLFLRSTTALSSGTSYGSGAVATGTTIMGTGTGENTPGINGKNPYAGPSLWGSKPYGVQTTVAPHNPQKAAQQQKP